MCRFSTPSRSKNSAGRGAQPASPRIYRIMGNRGHRVWGTDPMAHPPFTPACGLAAHGFTVALRLGGAVLGPRPPTDRIVQEADYGPRLHLRRNRGAC